MPSIAVAASVPITAGTAMASGGPSPSPPAPNPNNDDKCKGKGKGKVKGKNNGFGGSDNNSGNISRGAPTWPSFYNPWTGTVSMWSGMRPPQQKPVRSLQHALLTAPTYYGAPDGPSFVPLLMPPPY
jgi:hypothetical protein